MAETKRIFGIDYDDLEPYVKDKYNQRVEWSELYGIKNQWQAV